jgi:hypothetical protein
VWGDEEVWGGIKWCGERGDGVKREELM